MKDFRWKDGGMEGWKRPMKVPLTHTGRKDILRPMSTIAFLEQERTEFFCHTVWDKEFRRLARRTDSHTSNGGSNPATILPILHSVWIAGLEICCRPHPGA